MLTEAKGLNKKKHQKTPENYILLITGGGNVDPCVGPSVLSQSGCAREHPRKVDVPGKEVWGCPKYPHILKRKDF